MNGTRIATTVASTAMIAVALTACTGTQGDDSTPASGEDALDIGNFLDVTSWDPALADIGFDGPYLSAVYDALIALDENGDPIPSLATGWTVADDDLSIDLDIRTGVEFSDGVPLDADAVVANLEHLKNGARSGEGYLSVDSFEAIDDDTVRIILTERDDTILYFMGLGRSYMASPEAIEAGMLSQQPVGSGPYTLDDVASVPGAEYHFEKVADHWDAETYPFADLAIYPIQDQTARHNAMLSGQINVNYADATQIDQAEEQGWNVSSGVSGWVGLQFTEHTGEKNPALGEVEVRQAIAHAIDGAAILDSVGSGAGVVSNQVFPDGGAANVPAVDEEYAYSVEEAKRLLDEAGYPDGFEVTMPMSPIFQQWQPAAQQAFDDIGISVTWDDMQQPDYQLNAASYPMFIAFLAMDGNPVATLARQVTSPQWFNPEPDYVEFPEIGELVDEAQTLRGEAQIAAIAEVNEKLTEMAWWNVWYQAENIYFSADSIEVQPVVGMMFPTLRYIQQG